MSRNPATRASARKSTDEPSGNGARYYSGFYPMHLALLSVASNVLPVAWWTPVSKAPFRFVVAIDRRNHSLELLRRCGEAALHLLSWNERERVVRAGYASGKKRDKAAKLGFVLEPAACLAETRIVQGADVVFELRVRREAVDPDDDGDHVPFLLDVVHVHRGARPAMGKPLLFLGWRDFATLGERWRFRP